VYRQLVEIKNRLESHFRDMQDIEFTIQQGKLYILQTRTGKRTGKAAVKIAVDMVQEGLIRKEEAVKRIDPKQLDQLFHPQVDSREKKETILLAQGLNASPGAASGQIVFTANDAEVWAAQKKDVILVRKETSPEDIGGMYAARGVLTATGGMTSHAAVVARGMGRPCVAGCKELTIKGKMLKARGKTLKEGDFITIDGNTGEVFEGSLKLVLPKLSEEYHTLMGWVDEIRLQAVREGVAEKGFRVRTNADTPLDARTARTFGAEGIGLCRTEHMFFAEDKLIIFREMIVAEDDEARRKALKKLLPLQKKDFINIFKEMKGLPVTIRLLDPPLHEFVPTKKEEIRELANSIGIPVRKLEAKIQSLHEFNPMLGHRGCRLGITYPEIYDTQIEAIITAACEVAEKGIQVIPEIMFPLIGTIKELEILKENAVRVIETVFKKKNREVPYKLGTMIEIPRAALIADQLASLADFFSFGTNDLTQCVYGYSRDDVVVFLPSYLKNNILPVDPFKSIDEEGVGYLVKTAIQKGKKVKNNIKLGICGEHGGDPDSINFCYRVGMNYVSCSPYRVPIARLAAAQAVLKNGG
ncbi:MAG: pyruvate, phosphate dikinase, partial [Spirochaetales bacterium]|nr:pyruvate, phosphate dikinase [Spirochaetales bacterium]